MIEILISCLVILVSTILVYLYLTNREKENKTVKSYFTVTYNKRFLFFNILLLSVSVFIFLYSYCIMKETFLRSLLNGEVTLWLFTVGYIDLKEKIIPNKLIISGIVFWAVLSLLEIFVAQTNWKQLMMFSLTGGGVCGGVLFLIALVVKSALGMGDVKMFFVIGLLYGLWDTYSILLFSIIVMAIVSIVLLAAKKVTRKTAIPMAPFVAVGYLVCVLLGM